MSKHFLKQAAAGVLAAITFALFFIELRLHILFSAGIALAVYIGVRRWVGKVRTQSIQPESARGSSDYFQDMIDEGVAKLKEIKQLEATIRNDNIKQKVAAICDVGDDIIRQLRSNPRDVRLVQRFFSYYLDAVFNILTKYADISEKSAAAAGFSESLDKTEKVLDLLVKQLEGGLKKLMQEKVFDLDAEIAALEQIISEEGEQR